MSRLSSAVRRLLSAVYCIPSIVCHLPSAVCRPSSAICRVPSAVCRVSRLPSAVCRVYRLLSAACAVPPGSRVLFAVYSLLSAVYAAACTVRRTAIFAHCIPHHHTTRRILSGKKAHPQLAGGLFSAYVWPALFRFIRLRSGSAASSLGVFDDQRVGRIRNQRHAQRLGLSVGCKQVQDPTAL